MLCHKDNKLVYSDYRITKFVTPKTWKTETLKNLIERAILICPTEELLNEELKHLVKVFCEKNHFPK